MKTITNSVKLIGRLGQDPEFINLEGGKQVCKFPFATSQTYKNREGERITKTQWHQIVIWNGLAELASNMLSKGKQVALEGQINYRSYEDKEGVTRYVTEIVCDEMLILDPKSETVQEEAKEPMTTSTAPTSESSTASGETSSTENNDDVDDLPF